MSTLGGLVALAVFVSLATLGASAAATDTTLVTVGEVTATTAIVWARGAAPASLPLDVGAGDTLERRGALVLIPARDLTGRLELTGLRPATRYRYRIVAGAEAVASGEFVTAPDPDDARPVRFEWSGDLGGGGFCRLVDGGYPIFRAMAARHPDFFLFVGDTVYVDIPCNRPGVVPGANFVATTLAEFHARHRYNRDDPAVQAFFRGTSIYAIWDDHEVRNDFAGPTEPLMPVGRQAFVDYWPIAAPADKPTRLYRRARWGKLLDVFVLDTRQYRSPDTERDGPTKTMLGEAQRRWLIEGVTTSPAVWKVVVSSVPLSVPTGRRHRRDSWTGVGPWGLPEPNGTGFATERDLILGRFRAAGVRNLVFVSADVHHAEIIRHKPEPDFAFHELIAGPLSATQGVPRPLDRTLGSETIWARGSVNNFGEVSIDRRGLTVRIVGEDGAVLFTHAVPAE